jgi:hypothetical protein
VNYTRTLLATLIFIANVAVEAAAAPTPAPSAVPAALPSIAPLTAAQLKDPAAALTVSRRLMGEGAWKKLGGMYVTGFVQTQNQSLPFTSVTDLRNGYSRTIILLPRNGGAYEFGADRDGGWSAVDDRLSAYAIPPANLKAALYVDRFGFFNTADLAVLKEIGVDPTIGDRITVTPSGGASILAILKPETGLVSAVQFANGQVDVYADYRPVDGILFPYRIMQGSDPKAMSVFQASNIEFTAGEPDVAPISRPALPLAPPAPAATTNSGSAPAAR